MILRLILWMGAAGIAVFAYASLIERNWFAVRTHRIPCLPPGAEPIRVLHISDLHLRSVQKRKRAFLKRLAVLQPDLIVGTGDLLGDPKSTDAVVDAIGDLPFKTAALFVCGSNDYYAPVFKNPLRYLKKKKRAPHLAGPQQPWEDMVNGLSDKGWTYLSNHVRQIGDIDVVGLDDAHIKKADISVASARTNPGFRLAVAHSPDSAQPLADLGYDLILCGHTHGGQVCVPFYGALVTNCTLPREMARGAHKLGDSWLHVCGGLGTSMYSPYRLACRPEVCVLELVPR